LRNHKFPTADILAEKVVGGVKVIAAQKGASPRGHGGHRMTKAVCTSLQTQLKNVVHSVTAKTDISKEQKVCFENKTKTTDIKFGEFIS
jgi:hypothetical protein